MAPVLAPLVDPYKWGGVKTYTWTCLSKKNGNRTHKPTTSQALSYCSTCHDELVRALVMPTVVIDIFSFLVSLPVVLVSSIYSSNLYNLLLSTSIFHAIM